MKICLQDKWKGTYGRMKNLICSHWVKLLIVAELLVLLWAGITYYKDVTQLVSYHFDKEQLMTFTEEEYSDCFGGTISESRGGGLYDTFPEVFLEKGHYRYTVTYESSSPGSFCWPHSYVKYYNAFEEAVTYFENGSTSSSDDFWMNVDLHMTLRLYYNGVGSVSITDVVIEETTYGANVTLFYTLLWLLIFNIIICVVVYDRKKGISAESKYAFVGLVMVGFVASIPSLVEYNMNGHDLEFHFMRIEGIKDGWLSGQFPVRINPDFFHGYGYANPIFYGEILLYIPALLRLVGFPLSLCYNIFVVLINLFTCFGCYYCLKRMTGKSMIAVAGALLYILAPYRLLDIYIRAAVGEYAAMAFLPFVVYGMYRIYTEDVESKRYKWCFLPSVFGISGIIHTHVITGEMAGAMIILTCILLLPGTMRKQRLWALVKTVLVTLGVNAWFLVPFVDFTLTQEIRAFQTVSAELLQETGALLPQLFTLFMHYAWDNLAAGDGIKGEMPLTLGLALVLGLALCAAMLWAVRKEDGEEQLRRKKQGLVILVLSGIAVWMSTIYFPWDSISTRLPQIAQLVASMQFVWRFLSLGTVLAVFASCYGLLLLWQKEGKNMCMSVAVALCLLTGVSGLYFMQECIRNQPPMEVDDLKYVETADAASGGEYILSSANIYTLKGVSEPRAFEGVEIQAYEKQGTRIEMTVESGDAEGYVLLPLMNYKGYTVTSNDGIINKDHLVMNEEGVVKVNIPADYNGTLKVFYQGCWYWRIAELVSLVCMVYLGIMIWKEKKRNQ